MKLNKIMLIAALSLGISSVVHAADPVPPAPPKFGGGGTVTFTGSIIDAPCSIAAGSEELAVPLGQISKVALKNGGQSKARTFSISLENCEVGETDKNKVFYLFSGPDSSTVEDMLAITGAAGAGVVITDGDNKVLTLGKMSDKPQKLVSGNNTLTFSAYLKGDGSEDAKITEGEFSATADFKLYYQ